MEEITRDKTLLKNAIGLFGDIVVDAFVEKFHRSKPDSPTRIRFGGETIRLVFNNGKVVEFESSEWASMSTPSADKQG